MKNGNAEQPHDMPLSWLSRLSPTEARRYQGRIGVVTGYRLGADQPIVTFAKDGRRKEQKLFEVRISSLEIVCDANQ